MRQILKQVWCFNQFRAQTVATAVCATGGVHSTTCPTHIVSDYRSCVLLLTVVCQRARTSACFQTSCHSSDSSMGNLPCICGRVTKGASLCAPLLFALGQHASLCAIDEGLAEGERLRRFLTMCTSRQIVRVCSKHMAVLSESCGGTLASVCMKGRHKSGIQVANVLRSAMCWNGLPKLRIQKLVCGTDLGCLRQIKAFGCWGHHWRRLRGNSIAWTSRWPSTVAEPNSRGARSAVGVGSPSSLRLNLCKLHVAGGQARVGPRVRWRPWQRAVDMCAGFLAHILRTQGRASLPASLFHWEGWACGVPPAHVRQPTGPVGPIVCSWWGTGIQSWLTESLLRWTAWMNSSAHGQQQSQLTIWRVLRVSKSPRGRLSRMDSVPDHVTRKIVNLEDFNTAGNRVERHFRDRHLMPRLAEHEMALLRSQSGPYAGMALSVAPASFLTRIDSALFRVFLLRRLRLPLPLSFRLCRCGRPLDSFGHHRAACSRAGVLGRRGFAVESAAARVCREAGGRVTLNMMVRDMDLAVPHAHDTRRLEVVADGLPLFGGTQLAIDTTLVSTLHCDGSARRGAAHSGQAQEGAHLSRADRTTCSGQIGGFSWRGWGSLVRWDTIVLVPVGQGQSTVWTVHPQRQGRASLEVEVGFNLGVQSCSGFRFFSTELASRWRCGWECAQDARGGEWVPPRRSDVTFSFVSRDFWWTASLLSFLKWATGITWRTNWIRVENSPGFTALQILHKIQSDLEGSTHRPGRVKW